MIRGVRATIGECDGLVFVGAALFSSSVVHQCVWVPNRHPLMVFIGRAAVLPVLSPALQKTLSAHCLANISLQ